MWTWTGFLVFDCYRNKFLLNAHNFCLVQFFFFVVSVVGGISTTNQSRVNDFKEVFHGRF